MATVISDRGRGPEIAGTRITIYHLLPYFLDATTTEEYIARVHGLTVEEVAAARAYVLNNPMAILAEHDRIEARIAEGNPPDLIERAQQTHDAFVRFRESMARRGRTEMPRRPAAGDFHGTVSGPDSELTFRDWLDQTNSRPVEGP